MSLSRHAIFAILIVAFTARGLVAQTLPTTAPADPLAVAQSALAQLDQLRVVGANDPARVLELLKTASETLAQAKELAAAPAVPSTAPAARGNRRGESAQAANAQQRVALCQISFMQAELHRRAGAALPQDHAERIPEFERALAAYKGLRVEFRDVVAGRLGYAGEARVHRAVGDLGQAEAVLAPVAIALDERRLAQQPPAALQVQRVLWLERVETAFAKGAAAGNELAEKLSQSALMAEAAREEKAALKWMTLRAAVDATLAGLSQSDPTSLAEQLRDAELAAVVPEYQRLGLLAQLSQKRKVPLTGAEQLAWARLQSWAGLRDQAMATYAAATSANPNDVPAPDWHAYGSLLYASGKLDAAADALARGLASIAPDSPQRLLVLQAIAAGRLKVAREAPADAAKREAAVASLWELAEAATDPTVRREALRNWAFLQQQRGALAGGLDALAKFPDDVLADPYLCLLASEAKLRAAIASKQPTDAMAALEQEIQTNLGKLLPQADDKLAASLVLVMAQASAARGAEGQRAALDVLARHEGVVKPDAPATPQIQSLKLRLLMESGLTAEAETLAASLQGETLTPAAALKLADMLADRYAGPDAAPAPQATRERIVQLVSRGLAGHARDATYREAALRGARTLLKVRAYADAEHLLAAVKPAESSAGSDPAVALLTAESLRGQGKIEEAQKLLETVGAATPDAGEVHLATGRLQHDLQQWEAAAAAYRLARKQLAAGGAAWWQATVGLGECLAQQGNVGGARELLRVANAMYRSRAPASLLPRIDAVLKQPVSSADARGGRNG